MEKGEKIHGEFGVHTILDEEEIAFADWINHALDGDCDVAHKLPLASNGHDMYAKADDGVMLCKMINLACPNTVDTRVINTGKKISIFKVTLSLNLTTLLTPSYSQQQENLRLAINSSKAIGCVVVGIDAHNIHSDKGKKWLLLGILWQLIKMALYKEINLTTVPGLVRLLQEGEDINDLLKLSPEQILVRWVNYQLEMVSAGTNY